MKTKKSTPIKKEKPLVNYCDKCSKVVPDEEVEYCKANSFHDGFYFHRYEKYMNIAPPSTGMNACMANRVIWCGNIVEPPPVQVEEKSNKAKSYKGKSMEAYTEKKTWWVLNEFEILESEGLKRGAGYWFFSKLGFSIDETCLFKNKELAKSALIRKLKKTIMFYEEKLEKVQNES